MSDAMSRNEVVEKLNEAMGDPKVPGYYLLALQECLRLLAQYAASRETKGVSDG